MLTWHWRIETMNDGKSQGQHQVRALQRKPEHGCEMNDQKMTRLPIDHRLIVAAKEGKWEERM